jgi:hypothetical protein
MAFMNQDKKAAIAERQLVGHSHGNLYSYWLDPSDRYVYQRDELECRWIGWICAQSVWELRWSKGSFITPSEVPMVAG